MEIPGTKGNRELKLEKMVRGSEMVDLLVKSTHLQLEQLGIPQCLVYPGCKMLQY